MALTVGMGIRREDVARHVAGQIPLSVVRTDRDIDAGEVATVVAVTGAHDDAQHVTAPHDERPDRTECRAFSLRTFARAVREDFAGLPAPHLDRPKRAIATELR